jgi:hypothetical protein
MPVSGRKTSVNGIYASKAWFMQFFAKNRLDREDFYAIKLIEIKKKAMKFK